MKTLWKIGFTVIVIPTILIVMTRLLDMVLTRQVIRALRDIMQAIDYIIGTRATNLILCIVSLTIFITFIKWLGRLFEGNTSEE